MIWCWSKVIYWEGKGTHLVVAGNSNIHIAQRWVCVAEANNRDVDIWSLSDGLVVRCWVSHYQQTGFTEGSLREKFSVNCRKDVIVGCRFLTTNYKEYLSFRTNFMPIIEFPFPKCYTPLVNFAFTLVNSRLYLLQGGYKPNKQINK